MKTKILTKVAIASAICAPACGVERGVIIDRQESAEENALYVNLIQKNKEKQKQLFIEPDGIYDADRKLFFMDSTYIEPFIYALPGDTISFRNPKHETFIDMDSRHRVRSINSVSERKIMNRIHKAVRQRQR